MALSLWLAVPGRAQEVRAFGLVIGANLSSSPDAKPLRYADDDAIQHARLLNELGAQVVLLVEPDAESRSLFPDLVSTPPTRGAVDAALTRLNALMDQARAQGQTPVLYLFYSGHGDVENNEGYVNLHGDRLWRKDLLQLLQRSRATQNHVVIDACKSYFLVFDRGAGGSRSPVVTSLLDVGESIPGNTGVFLSTSTAADSHEWEAFRGGIFSHELRSALRGAADVNLDGRVTYEEVGAFVWSANAAISNPRYRPRFFSRPPGAARASDSVLFHVDDNAMDRLLIGPGVQRHIYVEDEQGLRLADLRPDRALQIALRLPSRRPLFVRHVDTEDEIVVPAGRELRLAMLPVQRSTSARRGAEHVAFGKLFAQPFGPASLTAYRERPPLLDDDAGYQPNWSWPRYGLAIGSAGVGVTGALLTALATAENASVTATTPGLERGEVNTRIDGFNAGAVICYALSGAGVAAFLLWTLWPEPAAEVEVMAP